MGFGRFAFERFNSDVQHEKYNGRSLALSAARGQRLRLLLSAYSSSVVHDSGWTITGNPQIIAARLKRLRDMNIHLKLADNEEEDGEAPVDAIADRRNQFLTYMRRIPDPEAFLQRLDRLVSDGDMHFFDSALREACVFRKEQPPMEPPVTLLGRAATCSLDQHFTACERRDVEVQVGRCIKAKLDTMADKATYKTPIITKVLMYNAVQRWGCRFVGSRDGRCKPTHVSARCLSGTSTNTELFFGTVSAFYAIECLVARSDGRPAEFADVFLVKGTWFHFADWYANRGSSLSASQRQKFLGDASWKYVRLDHAYVTETIVPVTTIAQKVVFAPMPDDPYIRGSCRVVPIPLWS